MHLVGTGCAAPPHAIHQEDATKMGRALLQLDPDQERRLAILYRRAGVESRRSCLLTDDRGSQDFYRPAGTSDDPGPSTRERMEVYEREAGPLAARAARAALEDADLPPAEVTHLVTISCTGFFAPGVDAALIRGLELPPTVQRTNVGFMGCHGAFNGLRVAAAMTAAEPEARVLIAAVELCSLHFYYGWDAGKLVANALFADGAAAVVGAADGAADLWRARRFGSYFFPGSEDDMTWRIGNNGFEMSLSSRVPDLVREGLRPWIVSWLAESGLTLEQVSSWAVHPGGPRILDAVEASLDLPSEATSISREVLAACGNMSSPTVLWILDRLRREGAERPCVALGFGPGLCVEAALFV